MFVVKLKEVWCKEELRISFDILIAVTQQLIHKKLIVRILI